MVTVQDAEGPSPRRESRPFPIPCINVAGPNREAAWDQGWWWRRPPDPLPLLACSLRCCCPSEDRAFVFLCGGRAEFESDMRRPRPPASRFHLVSEGRASACQAPGM